MSQSKMTKTQKSSSTSTKLDSLVPESLDGYGGSDLPEYNSALPIALLRAREAVMSKFLPFLKEHDLSAQQWRVIRSLDQEDGVDISELSERCYLLKPSMSRIVQNLEARKIITRQNVTEDKRRISIYLTNKGRELVKEIAPKSEERYKFISDQFGSSKLKLLQELLEDLIDSISEKNH